MELALKNALAHQRSERAALTDPLTSLTNRRGMERQVRELRGGRRLAVLAIDVDRLKEVNDRHGHAAGDGLLLAVADAIRSVRCDGDVVARVGGDEFAWVEFGADAETAALSATQMLKAVRGADHPCGEPRVSIGVACGELGEPLAHVLRRADAAMYRSKRAGGMRFALAAAEPEPPAERQAAPSTAAPVSIQRA
jgi:diguanylate cyclase (GGDEF)-like protein